MKRVIIMALTTADVVAGTTISITTDQTLNLNDYYFDMDISRYYQIIGKVVVKKTSTGGLVQESVILLYKAITP